MLSDLSKALIQLGTPSLRGVLFAAIGFALLALLLVAAGATWVIAETTLFAAAWLEWIKTLLGGMLAALLAWLIFPAAVAIVASLYLERVASAVERVHYPHLPPPRAQGVAEALVAGLKIGALTLLLNLAALPIYFLSTVFAPLLFVAINGYLAGRDYFEQVAQRRMSPAAASALRRTHRGTVFVAGMVIAAMMLVPVLNLFTPVAAIAFMLHRFERLRGVSSGAGPFLP